MLTGHLGEAGWAFGERRLQCSQKARLGDEDLESSLSRKQGGRVQSQSLLERLRGLRCGLLDASFGCLQIFLTFFLSLAIFRMPQKWLEDEWFIALYMQIHKIHSKVIK